ncbi:MAG: PepSY domain-containing protein [Sphingomonadales bacterium]|nr:PepSY domain-containing protein [Sphingomonadales bacterium]
MKLRRYHRWLAILFGAVLLWVAGTGVVMQLLDIYDHGGLSQPERPGAPPTGAGIVAPAQAHEPGEEEHEAGEHHATAPGSPVAAAPVATASAARPPRSKAQQLHGFILHLHSGEWFGPLGTLIQTLAGLALIFFAVSGL